MLPNFLICGAPKAGTSSLHTWIAAHPDALGAIEKETYFCVDPGSHMYRPGANILQGLQGYERYFRLSKSQRPNVVLESTPAYIYYETALRYVPGLPTKPKCLFLLREPAQQIYSLFTYFQSNWSWIPHDMRFSEYLEILRSGKTAGLFRGNELAQNALINGHYVNFLLRWRDQLGPERIKVLSFDRLKDESKLLTQEVASWIGLEPSFYETYDFPRDNETYAVRNKALQRLNVAVRGVLPRGVFYSSMRAIYRRLNTQSPSKPEPESHDLVAELAQDYAESNARLRDEFGLDLPSWA